MENRNISYALPTTEHSFRSFSDDEFFSIDKNGKKSTAKLII